MGMDNINWTLNKERTKIYATFTHTVSTETKLLLHMHMQHSTVYHYILFVPYQPFFSRYTITWPPFIIINYLATLYQHKSHLLAEGPTWPGTTRLLPTEVVKLLDLLHWLACRLGLRGPDGRPTGLIGSRMRSLEPPETRKIVNNSHQDISSFIILKQAKL